MLNNVRIKSINNQEINKNIVCLELIKVLNEFNSDVMDVYHIKKPVRSIRLNLQLIPKCLDLN